MSWPCAAADPNYNRPTGRFPTPGAGFTPHRPQGSMRVTAPSPLSATQTAVSPTATAPGSEPTSIGPPVALAALEVDPGDRVLAGAGDPDGAGAGVDPAGAAADFDRVAEHGVDRGVDLGDGVAAAVGDPDQAVGDGDPGGAAADRDRGVDVEAAEVDPAHAAGRGAADPEAAGADREPQRRRVRRQAAALTTRPLLALTAVTPGAVFVGDPDVDRRRRRSAPGLPPTVDRLPATRPRVRVDARAPRRGGGSETQTEPAPTATPEMPGPSWIGLPTASPLSGSSRVRVPSGSLVTQIASASAAIRSGAAPIGIGSETWTPSPPTRTRTSSDHRRRGPPGRRPRGRAPCPAAARRPLALPRRPLAGTRPPIATVARSRGPAAPGSRRRARLREHLRRRHPRPLALARGGDQRAGARVALGRVLRRPPARSPRPAPPASPARCRPPCGRRGRSRSAPRRGRSRASRRRRPARPSRRATAPATCTRRCRPPRCRCWTPLSPERLGEAEVGEEGAVAFDQDVVRLDVAVDDAGGVGGVERFGDLAEQGDRPRRRQRPLAVDQPPQVAAGDQPHRHDQLAVDLARVVDRHHRRVVEAGGEPGLAQEALAESPRGRPARGRSPSAPPAVPGPDGSPGRRPPSRPARSAHRAGSRRGWSRLRVSPPGRLYRLRCGSADWAVSPGSSVACSEPAARR